MRPPPTTRIVLPALVSFQFRGASEYLEDLVSRIDSPQVNGIFVNYFNQFVDFQVARLSEFINRSLGPEVTLFRHAQVSFFSDKVFFTMYRQANHPGGDLRTARTLILCQGIDWQVSHIAQVLSQFSTTLSTVAHLKLKVEPKGRQLEGMDDAEWLNLLYQFSTVKTLHVSQELAEHVALALKDIAGESVTEVLPSLDLICLAGQPASSVEEFVAARRQYDRPVIVIDTERIFNEKVRSYLGRVYIPMQPYTQTNIPSFGNVSSIPVAGVPVWPAPSMTGDLDLTFNWESQAITLPQDPHVNEVTRTLIGSGNTVLVPEITLPWILPVRRRASSPTPGIGVPPKISRSTTRTCPNPACTSAGYIRRQELTRHVITHLPYSIYCPHPNCNWRGRRYDTFGNHYINGHPHDQVPDRHSFHEYTIYDARLLAEFLINKKVTLEEAIDDADAEVREMAVKLGKWDMWNLQPPSVRELVLGQLSHHICCSHPCCVWRGSRHYALMKHWQEEHPHDQGPDCGPLDAPLSTIYNARQLVERLIDREVTLKQAIDEADVAVRKKAVELGKWDMWNLAHLGQTGHSGVVARNLGLP
ncbi:hypothetical protein H4582DRAFT_1942279 [Lactarius indigo]|nr:hypothetical protein H4582DRAFT_1942279 [Lactarius indigo]